MKEILLLLFIPVFLSCGYNESSSNGAPSDQLSSFTEFDSSNHLQPLFDKIRFDTLQGWDFGWAILEPINVAKNDKEETELSKRLSPGQKALYFLWYLNDEVTNGGFIQFYWNDYRKYLSPIIDGLKLIGDSSMVNLVEKTDKEYLAHQKEFDQQKQVDDWEPLYEKLKNFEKYDSIYYATQNKMMEILEKYARQHSEEFVRFE